MTDLKKWEKKVNENHKRNVKFIKEFEEWLLTEKKLSKKTVSKYASNARFYINEFLNYYDAYQMEEGCKCVSDYLGSWFIEKCLWSSKNQIKETARSIKKFYECMSEKGYVKKEDYEYLCDDIKDGMDTFLERMDDYDNGTFYDIYL